MGDCFTNGQGDDLKNKEALYFDESFQSPLVFHTLRSMELCNPTVLFVPHQQLVCCWYLCRCLLHWNSCVNFTTTFCHNMFSACGWVQFLVPVCDSVVLDEFPRKIPVQE